MAPQTIVKRPPVAGAPAEGLFRAEHVQIAYVTSDMKRAREVMAARYEVPAFLDIEAPCQGGQMRVGLAWVGGVMIELVEAWGPETDFFTDRLPKDGFALRHHHFGYAVPDPEAWDELKAEVERNAWPVVFEGDATGLMRYLYIEAPDLGHYLEYFLLEPGGVALFDSLPTS